MLFLYLFILFFLLFYLIFGVLFNRFLIFNSFLINFLTLLWFWNRFFMFLFNFFYFFLAFLFIIVWCISYFTTILKLLKFIIVWILQLNRLNFFLNRICLRNNIYWFAFLKLRIYRLVANLFDWFVDMLNHRFVFSFIINRFFFIWLLVNQKFFDFRVKIKVDILIIR